MKMHKRFIIIASIIGITFVSFTYGMIFGFIVIPYSHIPVLYSEGNIQARNKGVSIEKLYSSRVYESDEVDFNLFFQVWDYVKDGYVDKSISDKQLFYGALSGIVGSLQDPYSVFLEPETNKKFQQELSGKLEGIGAEIGLRDEVITVIAPLPDSPAKRAGIRSGDKILAIDEVDTYNMSLDYAVSKIRGTKGTKVKLTILHTGENSPVNIEVVRDTIRIVSVSWEKKDDNIAYIELKYFNQDTLGSFRKMVREVAATKPKGIIFDLRNNPGGLLNTAIEVTAEWVGNEDIIVIEKMRNENVVGHKAQRGNPQFKGIPTVVLINNGSASGSEIVAGALQDYKQAIIVGETSFGKGSVQDLKQLKDGSSVKLTIALWLTPAGRKIDKEGIKPDVEVKLTKEDHDNFKDPQLDKALEILQEK